MRPRFALIALLALGACSYSRTTETLRQDSPPSELGRPGWVTVPADVGTYVGGGVGALASVVLLPITWPLGQLADTPLGYSRDEFVWGLLGVSAAGGNFLLGSPFDALDFTFRRAWVNEPRPTLYRYEEQPAPVGPTVDRPGALAQDEQEPQDEQESQGSSEG